MDNLKKATLIWVVALLSVLGCDESPVYPGQSPTVPRNPSPEMGATGQDLTLTLSWECSSPEGRPLTYDVYIGRGSPPPRVATGVPSSSYEVENLVPNRRYFWRIVARDDRGLVAWIEATPEAFRLKGSFRPPKGSGPAWSHPVIHQGRLYLRHNDLLLCYDLRATG